MSASEHFHRPQRLDPHRLFEGRSSRVYEMVAQRLLAGLYLRIAQDLAIATPRGGMVLDVGCGPGEVLIALARLRSDVHLAGVDLSAGMVAAAATKLGAFGNRASAKVADVADLPFPPDTFDLIVSSFSLHHWSDIEAATQQIGHVLRPEGQLFVYDFQRAPFGQLEAAFRTDDKFAEEVQHTVIRTGGFPLRRCTRHVLIAPGPARTLGCNP